jgi:UDP-N-acetylmuramoylalanine--D-glutamate ligase
VCASRLAGVEAAAIREAVESFRAVEHRLEFVAEIGGVEYYNDSKATNVDASEKAISSFEHGVHLILGGKDKGSDYRTLAPLIAKRARAVYLIGAASEKIESHLRGTTGGVPIHRAGTLSAAVEQAAGAAVAGDVVLLAPACSSFDQFENYEQRGTVFKELVLARRGVGVWQGV